MKLKMSLHNMFRMMVGFGLLIGGVGRFIIHGPISELPRDEIFLIPLLFVTGVYFMHAAFISDLEDRVKRLELAASASK